MKFRKQLSTPLLDDIQETLDDFSTFRPINQPMTLPKLTFGMGSKISNSLRGQPNQQQSQRFFESDDL